MYQWVAWLHVLFAFVFIFAHGVSMATAFLLPHEKNVDKMKLLLDLPNITIIPLGVSLLGLLVTSIYMGGTAGWWKTGWWGLSFLLMIALVVWMTWYSRVIYSPIRRELGLFYMSGLKNRSAPDENKSVNMAEVERLIALSNPALLTWVGLIVTAALLWLMRFKPF
jgi:hypothetical protein